MRAGPSKIRVAALVFAAALALHELRYLIAYGGGAGRAQAEQGHGYLPGAELIALALLALAGAGLLRALARARLDDGRATPLLVTSLAAAAALALIYTGQEMAEGLLSSGHPAGLAAILGHGGAVAYALALPLGGLVALGLQAARAAVRAAARRQARPRATRRPPLLPRPTFHAPFAPASVLARKLAGRAPPLVS